MNELEYPKGIVGKLLKVVIESDIDAYEIDSLPRRNQSSFIYGMTEHNWGGSLFFWYKGYRILIDKGFKGFHTETTYTRVRMYLTNSLPHREAFEKKMDNLIRLNDL